MKNIWIDLNRVCFELNSLLRSGSDKENNNNIYIYTRFLIYEKVKASVKEKQVFISTYLQYLHIYLSATIGLQVPGLSLFIDKEFDDSKLCRTIKEPIQY